MTMERDWWPLTRLVAVGVVMGIMAHLRFGWNPHLRDAWAIPGGLAVIVSFIVMLSSGLAHICLIALMIPFCGIILCNDWFYDASFWMAQAVVGRKSAKLNAGLGLCGEILLFGGAASLIHRWLF